MTYPEIHHIREFFAELTKELHDEEATTASDAFEKMLDADIEGMSGRLCFKAITQYMSFYSVFAALSQLRIPGLSMRQTHAARYMWQLLVSEITDGRIEEEKIDN